MFLAKEKKKTKIGRVSFGVVASFLLWVALIASCKGAGAGTETSSSDGTGDGPSTEPLSWMEEQFAHKWSRYHGYDGSYRYFILKDDSSACFFEITSSGSRINNKNYAHWELDEENPVAGNVFDVIVQYEGGTPFFRGLYYYAPNEFWQGGSSYLLMRPSTTWRDCE